MRKGKMKNEKGKSDEKQEIAFNSLPAFTFCLFTSALSSDSPFDGIIRIRFKGSPREDSQPRSQSEAPPKKHCSNISN
jgi:hypothetical protein